MAGIRAFGDVSVHALLAGRYPNTKEKQIGGRGAEWSILEQLRLIC